MDATLLILAAGMGSRYGGLKQLDPVGPSGETILDYSIFDALRSGVSRVVFVIRRDFEPDFRKRVLARYEGLVEVAVVFQEICDLPAGFVAPAGREKPWGTAHAIWCARRAINGAFLVVNADDFYGWDSFSRMKSFLDSEGSSQRMAMVGYRLENTLSEHGAVSRGVCETTADRMLRSVEECTGIVREADGVVRGVDGHGRRREFTGAELVSMNFWGFQPAIFGHLEKHFAEFLVLGGIEKPRSEFYIPSAVASVIASGEAPASVIPSEGRWFGVTYREDRPLVARALAELVTNGHYLTPLGRGLP